MSESATTITNPEQHTGVPPVPPEAHQRAALEMLDGACATYCAQDNKLRMTCATRLDEGLFRKVREAGFVWAPRQKIFVAPAWTPEREDLLLQLCGAIGDEEGTLAERAEDRAQRFEGYGESRAQEAATAHAQVRAIADHIPLGQPILVGHHSEARARRAKKRIDDGMRRAVQCWDQAGYWARRAKASLAHAERKESPAVRHRRIANLEADQRKMQRAWQSASDAAEAWRERIHDAVQALAFAGANYVRVHVEGEPHGTTVYQLLSEGRPWRDCVSMALGSLESEMERARRWIDHYEMRLGYERAMLADSAGTLASHVDLMVGGRVKIAGEWVTITRLNKTRGELVSVTTNARYVPVRGVEEISEYEAPSAEAAVTVAAAAKQPPICNYPGPGFQSMTMAEWSATHRDYKGTRELGAGATRMRPGAGRPDIADCEQGSTGRHRVRVVVARRGGLVPVFLSDKKEVLPPSVDQSIPAAPPLPSPERDAPARSHIAPDRNAEVEAMRRQLDEGGVEVHAVPELFATSALLADQVIAQVPLVDGMTICEPSAGTGALLAALFRRIDPARVVVDAVEFNAALAASLQIRFPTVCVHHGDFLAVVASPRYDLLIMNPPFSNARDIQHIKHAHAMLNPGGHLIAICADGPRQRACLAPWADACGGSYTALPAGSFKEAGTMVPTALVVLHSAG